MAVRRARGADRPFVGRRHELRAATEILAAPDRAGVALIGGESGLGKTRLVEEIVARATDDVAIVRCGAVPRVTPIPFELVRPAVGPGSSFETDGPLAEQVRTVAEAIRSHHDDATIFVFEDIHWADPESLDVIDRLMATGPANSSVLITYRPNALAAGDPTSVFLQRAERRTNVLQLRLEPLRRDEVGDYLEATGRSVDAATVQHVHSRTGGNPLMLCELVASTAEDADLTTGLPWTLAEMLRPEIEQLPPDQRRVVDAVAVLGAEVGFDLLAAAVDSTETGLIGRLRALVDVGILIESGPDRFSFRHDMVREAVADSLFTREHRRIHAAVHDALLAADSDDVVALVEHASGAGRTKQAADAARDAAKHAMAEGRTHQALAFAEQALLEHTDDIDLLRTAVVAGWMTGQRRVALHHLDRWEEVAGGSGADRAAMLHYRVRLLWEDHDVAGADSAADELQAICEAMEPSAARAQALADVAQHYMLSGRAKEAIEWADRALATAEEVGETAAAARRQARAERTTAMLASDDDKADVIATMLQIAEEAEAAGDYVVASRMLHNIPFQHPSIDAPAHVERMRRTSERAGMSFMATETYRIFLLILAQIEDDRATFEAVLETAREDLGRSRKLDLIATVAAINRGDFAEARSILDALARHLADEVPVAWRAGLGALVDHHEGDSGPLLAWFEDLPRHHSTEQFALEMGLAYLSSLRSAGFDDVLRKAFASDVVDSSREDEPALLAVRAELAGDHERAEGFYAKALASGGYNWAHEKAEMELARARIATATSRPGDAAQALERACALVAEWPGPLRNRIQALLGTRRPPAGALATDESSSALTPREREVARLVEKGLTNGGIADELFISTKTASVHVSNILAKLAMSSRTEIAAWVARGGLT